MVGRLDWKHRGSATRRRKTAGACRHEAVGCKSLNAQALVRPGSSVDLQVTVPEPAEVADFAKKAQASIDASVKANQLVVKGGEATRLVVSMAPSAVAGTFTLETFALGAGAGKREQVTVQKKGVTIRIAYEAGILMPRIQTRRNPWQDTAQAP